MLSFGARLARACECAALIFLDGDLGMGKTTLTRGLLRELGFQGAVKSPTYTLVEGYDIAAAQRCGFERVYHFDLYRLGDPEELEYMGIRDYIDQQALCLIEWPEKGRGILPRADILVRIEPVHNGRLLVLRAASAVGESVLQRLAENDANNNPG